MRWRRCVRSRARLFLGSVPPLPEQVQAERVLELLPALNEQHRRWLRDVVYSKQESLQQLRIGHIVDGVMDTFQVTLDARVRFELIEFARGVVDEVVAADAASASLPAASGAAHSGDGDDSDGELELDIGYVYEEGCMEWLSPWRARPPLRCSACFTQLIAAICFIEEYSPCPFC